LPYHDGMLLRARAHQIAAYDFASQSKWQGPYFFVQAADPQFGMFDKDERWDRETVLFERTVAEVNRLRPRFLVISGDQVNAMPGGPQYHAQNEEFFRIVGMVDPSIPVICLPGNHDTGDSPDLSALKSYREYFGDDWYEFWLGGVCYLVIDTCLYHDPSRAAAEQDAQHAWLAATLTAARAKNPRHIVLLQHHPWFLDAPDDGDQYFTIPRVRREPALALLRDAQVAAVFAGHYHRNAGGWDGDLEMVTTSAVGMPLGEDPSGFRVVEVYEDRIQHRYFGLDDVPTRILLDPMRETA